MERRERKKRKEVNRRGQQNEKLNSKYSKHEHYCVKGCYYIDLYLDPVLSLFQSTNMKNEYKARAYRKERVRTKERDKKKRNNFVYNYENAHS